MGLEGFNTVIGNLNKEIKEIKGRSLKGLLEACTLVRYDMDHTSPVIPVDTGNLRQSWFISPVQTAEDSPAVKAGFSANYAVYVHEMLQSRTGKKINWSRPGSGPKFYEASLKRNVKEILRVIGENANIK